LEGRLFYGSWGWILGALSIAESSENLEWIDTVHRSCWGFWARRARISVDILELGSYLVGREERFWGVLQCFAAAVKETSGGQREDY
jgi:hypothetical protein